MSSMCPACNSTSNFQTDEVSTELLIQAYAGKRIQIDVRHHFPQGVGALRLLRCNACDLQWFTPTVAGDGPFYEALQKHEWYYEDVKTEYPLAAGLIKGLGDRPRILDVGCGRGAFSAHLDTGVIYRGLEFNERAVALANKNGLDVVRRDIADEANSAPASYDAVCHFQVLEHVPDVQGFMKSCVKALKPGGLLITTVPADDSFLRYAEEAWLNMPPHHITRWSDKSLLALFESLGVTGSRVWHEPVAKYHEDWYRNTLRAFALAKLMGKKPLINGLGPTPERAARLSQNRLMRAALDRLGALLFPHAGRGHSVTIWGTKSAAT